MTNKPCLSPYLGFPLFQTFLRLYMRSFSVECVLLDNLYQIKSEIKNKKGNCISLFLKSWANLIIIVREENYSLSKTLMT